MKVHSFSRPTQQVKAGLFIAENPELSPSRDVAEVTRELFIAVAAGNLDNVRLAIEEGADVNAFNSTGEPPLIIAIKKGEISVILYLIHAARADVNAQTSAGQTALHLAVLIPHHRAAVCDALLVAGADRRIRDSCSYLISFLFVCPCSGYR